MAELIPVDSDPFATKETTLVPVNGSQLLAARRAHIQAAAEAEAKADPNNPDNDPNNPTAGMGTVRLFLAGAGKRLNDLARGVLGGDSQLAKAVLPQGAGDVASNLINKITPDEPNPSVVDPLMNRTPAKIGYAAPDAALFAALPNMGTVGTALTAGAMGAMEPADTLSGRGVNAVKSAVPAGALNILASGLGKVGGAAVGDWGENQAAKRTSDELESLGIPTTISQLDQKSSFGTGQANAVAELLDQGGKNQAVESIKRAYTAAGQSNDGLWQALDNSVSGTTKVIPKEFMSGLQNFVKTYGVGVLTNPSNTPDRQMAAKLLSMVGKTDEAQNILTQELSYSESGAKKFVQRAASSPTGMNFTDVRDLQKTIGSISGQFNPTKGDPISDAASGLYSKLYDDLNRWQYNGTNKDAWKKFVAARDDFKTNVLPFENTWSVAKNAISGKYDSNPSKAMMDITAPSNRDQMTQIVSRLHPDDSKYLMAPLVTADNMRKAISRPYTPGQPPEISLPIVGPLERPLSNWAQDKYQLLTSSPTVKSLYFGRNVLGGGGLGRIRQGLAGASGAIAPLVPPFSSPTPPSQ